MLESQKPPTSCTYGVSRTEQGFSSPKAEAACTYNWQSPQTTPAILTTSVLSKAPMYLWLANVGHACIDHRTAELGHTILRPVATQREA